MFASRCASVTLLGNALFTLRRAILALLVFTLFVTPAPSLARSASPLQEGASTSSWSKRISWRREAR